MEDVRSLCRQCGVDGKGSRMDLILRLQGQMKNRASYDKMFQQIWGASGKVTCVKCFEICFVDEVEDLIDPYVRKVLIQKMYMMSPCSC